MNTSEQQWMVGLTQAQNFARKENYADAVVRARGVCEAIRAAQRACPDPEEKQRMGTFLRRAEEILAALEAQFHAWNEAIAERRAARMANAEAEQKRPLPPLPAR